MIITVYKENDYIETKINATWKEATKYYLSGGWSKEKGFIKIEFHDQFINNIYGVYKVVEAYKVPEETIKENLLIHPVRIKYQLVTPSDFFKELTKTEARKDLEFIDSAFTEIEDYTTINNYYKRGVI